MQEDKFLKRVVERLKELPPAKDQIPPVDLGKFSISSPPGFKEKPTIEEVRKALKSLGDTE